MGTSAPGQVVELVEHFERDRDVFLSADHTEEQSRREAGILRRAIVVGEPILTE